MADIFISYARADKARVERLVAALQANDWNVWWDAEVSPGEEFDDVIAAALICPAIRSRIILPTA